MYEFYEEPRHLNLKKVVIIGIILALIVLAIIFLIARKISTPKENTNSKSSATTTVFKSADNSVTLELPSSYNLKPYESNLGYLIELHSENNLGIFISKENVLENKTLAEIIEADKLAFLSNFDSYSNLSDTKELLVGDNSTYTYSFHYLDKTLNQAFYLQVIWLQIDNTFYIFDIEFPLDDLSFNTNLASSVLSSFKLN